MPIAIVSRAEISGKMIMPLKRGTGLRDAGHELRCCSSSWNGGDIGTRLRHLGPEVTNSNLGAISAIMMMREPVAPRHGSVQSFTLAGSASSMISPVCSTPSRLLPQRLHPWHPPEGAPLAWQIAPL